MYLDCLSLDYALMLRNWETVVFLLNFSCCHCYSWRSPNPEDTGTSGILVPAQHVQGCCNALSPAGDSDVSEHVNIGGTHINAQQAQNREQREQLESSIRIWERLQWSVSSWVRQACWPAHLILSPAFLIWFFPLFPRLVSLPGFYSFPKDTVNFVHFYNQLRHSRTRFM